MQCRVRIGVAWFLLKYCMHLLANLNSSRFLSRRFNRNHTACIFKTKRKPLCKKKLASSFFLGIVGALEYITLHSITAALRELDISSILVC